MTNDIFYRSADGLTLHACDDGPSGGTRVPLLCLPGLTRNVRDFADIAARLSPARRVIRAEFRGRGQSQYAPDPMTYRADFEMADTLALLDHLGLARVAVLGTSRGGIVAMLMAAKARERLAGIAFNDIGPHLEPEGLLRIASYLGKASPATTWDEAVAGLKASSPGISGLSEKGWLAFARSLYRDEGGRPVADYDKGLALTFPTAEAIKAGKSVDLWPAFAAVAPLPSLVLRGANSDLLSPETVSEMQCVHPGLAAVTIRDRAHVPFLDEPDAIAALDAWLIRVDAEAV